MKKYLLLLFLSTTLITAAKAQKTAIEKAPSKVAKLKVFPNPATTTITILGLKNTTKASILIFDIYGNSVLQHQWEVKNNALNIPVANLNKGIYTISISSKEQQVKTKFYKQ